MDNKFFTCETCETTLAICGPGGGGGGGRGFNKTWPILVHNYPLIYVNLHVISGNNLIRTFLFKVLKKKNCLILVFRICFQ